MHGNHCQYLFKVTLNWSGQLNDLLELSLENFVKFFAIDCDCIAERSYFAVMLSSEFKMFDR